jgi:hypothetical protein
MTDHTFEGGTPLSPAGAERRVRMLLELRAAMNRRSARRRTLRRAGAVASMALAGAAVWGAIELDRRHGVPPAGSPTTASAIGAADMAPMPGASDRQASALANIRLVSEGIGAAARSVVVSTDESKIERYVVSGPARMRVHMLNDEQLLQALAETGNVYGLVRAGDHVSVTCYTCPQPALETPATGGGAKGATPYPSGTL